MSTRTARPIPLALAMLIAVFSALVALAVSGGHDAAAHGTPSATAVVSQRELDLRRDMRRLWEEHVTWTRLAVISLTTGSPDTKATVARLLRNQADIGGAIAPFYGRKAAKTLTGLLREHILVAADLIGAAKAGDPAATAAQQARWTANADRIAAFLGSANPGSWTPAALRAMLHEHLRLTTREVVDRLRGKWADDVRTFDAIERQALHMADMLSTGIARQFPARVR